MNIKHLKIGARGSKLSLAQTEIFINYICNFYDVFEKNQLTVHTFKTTGDIEQNSRLDKLGGKGLFAKEIETQIMYDEVDIGLHSMKDMPATLNDQFSIACWLPRADPHDILITRSGHTLDELNPGSIIGTSSIRRRSQILQLRKDLYIKALRGNIDTRIKKLSDGLYDAIILSKAGLDRLELSYLKSSVLQYDLFLPAACQGAIGAEIKKSNNHVADILHPLTDSKTEICCLAERKVLQIINANCNTPIGILARIDNEEINLQVEVYNHDGVCIYKNNKSSTVAQADHIAVSLGNDIINSLGQKLIDGLDKLDDFDYSPPS